jgi:hypothetical protein
LGPNASACERPASDLQASARWTRAECESAPSVLPQPAPSKHTRRTRRARKAGPFGKGGRK